MAVNEEKILKWIDKGKQHKILWNLWHEGEDVRNLVLAGLKKRNISAVDLVVDALNDKSTAFKLNGLEIITYIQHEKMVDPVIILLGHKDGDVRKNALTALGVLGDDRAIGPVCGRLGDPDAGEGAAEILCKFDPDRTVAQVAEVLRSGDAHARQHAAMALNTLTHQQATKLAIAALRDEDDMVRMHAAKALQQKKEKEAAQALTDAFERGDLAVALGAPLFFILRGEAGSEDRLIEALDRYGDVIMCTLFLNSGNRKLEKAAENWSFSHGFRVEKPARPQGDTLPLWGRGIRTLQTIE